MKGTLDAMLSGSLWDLEDHVKENTKKYINEVPQIRTRSLHELRDKLT